MVLALIVLGLPALLTVPSLFALAHSGTMFSIRLLSGFARRPVAVPRPARDNRAFAVAIMLFAAAAAEYFLVPPLVQLVI